MNVNHLHKFYGTKRDIDLSARIEVSKSTISKWRKFGIPAEHQAVFQVQTGDKLKASLSKFKAYLKVDETITTS